MEILNEFKLNHRFCPDDIKCEGFSDIDFNYSRTHLDELRKQSVDYLGKALYEF